MSQYKPYPDALSCAQAAEACGRLYASSVAKPWPMPPDVYGPGRQPQPPAAYYQKYWQAPQPADPANALPIRMDVDATAQAFNGQKVTVTGSVQVTLDFTGLVVVASAGVADVSAG